MLPRTFVMEVVGQTGFEPPANLSCPPGTSPAESNGQWSCQPPLVQTHPILAVLLVAGFAVVFLGTLFLHLIFPA